MNSKLPRPSFIQRLRASPYWKWLTPGIGVKRWLVLFTFGVTLIALGLAFVLVEFYRSGDLPDVIYYLTLQFLPRVVRAIIVGAIGIGAIVFAAIKSADRSLALHAPRR